MIFLRYESFRSYLRFYPVTSFLLALNIVLFLADEFVFHRQITNWGAFYQHPDFDRYGIGEPWRFVTSIALHAGFDHLLFNSFSILVFAPPLERLLGHYRYLAFYLVSGVAGNVLSAVVHAGSEYASVGASGAIYGIFGAYLYLALFQKQVMDEASRKTVYSILGFGLIYSVIMPQINVWAHVGGGVAGFAMLSLLVRIIRRRFRDRNAGSGE